MSTVLRTRIALLTVIALMVAVLPAGAVGMPQTATVAPEGTGAGLAPTAVWPPDAYESDDSSATAKTLSAVSYHTWHVPDGAPDQDWFTFSVTATGTPVYIETMNDFALGQNHDAEIVVYDVAGNMIAANDNKPFPTVDAGVEFVVDAGNYYVRVAPDDENSSGSYWLHWGTGIGRRISGADRYATAVEVSRLMFSSADNANLDLEGSPNPAYAVVASGLSYADGLVGSTLASFCDGPLLLTDPSALPVATDEEITRLFRGYFYRGGVRLSADAPIEGGNVFVLGSEVAVSNAVINQIEANPYVGRVVRIGGPNRYATAAMAMSKGAEVRGIGGTAFVVNGLAWPDALAAAPVAASAEAALLLTGKSSVPASTTAALAELGVTKIVVVGSETVIDATAYADFVALVGAAGVERVGGANRYETSLMLAEWGIDQAGMNGSGMTLVSGENFPDGLSGGPISWWTGYPLLLTRNASLSPEVEDYVEQFKPFTRISYVLGGPSVVSTTTLDAWNAFGRPFPAID